MADDDDFVRITLRIPKPLHEQLNEAAARKRSMNAEIIARLETSFEAAPEGKAAVLSGEKLLQLSDEIDKALTALRKLREDPE